jgi:sulfur relay (sulfurtransferase) DsrC/TusE family protein
MVSGFESRKGIDPKSPIRDVSKNYFLDFNNNKKLKMLIKAIKKSTNMLNSKQKMRLMNGGFFTVLIQHD